MLLIKRLSLTHLLIDFSGNFLGVRNEDLVKSIYLLRKLGHDVSEAKYNGRITKTEYVVDFLLTGRPIPPPTVEIRSF